MASFPLLLIFALVAASISIVLSLFLAKFVMAKEAGNEEMKKVTLYIQQGANAFLKRQYTTLAYFVVGFSIIILLLKLPALNTAQMVAYLLGSFSSGLAGVLGMKVGVKANTRTAQASLSGLAPAFNVSFFGGAVMGLMVVGIALMGVTIIYMISGDSNVVLGFSLVLPVLHYLQNVVVVSSPRLLMSVQT